MKTAVFPSAFIFDWDNTLVDSWDAIEDAMNHTLTHFGRKKWSREEIKKNCTRAARDSFPEWFQERWQEASDVFYARFKLIQMQNLRLLKGSKELLVWLKSNNIPAFVVSNKNNVYLRNEVVALALESYFVAVAGSLDAPRDKPAREHVDFALAKGRLKADATVWFVGDSEADVVCARNAGCTPILIGSIDFAKKLDVQLVFTDCQALQSYLNNLQRT